MQFDRAYAMVIKDQFIICGFQELKATVLENLTGRFYPKSKFWSTTVPIANDTLRPAQLNGYVCITQGKANKEVQTHLLGWKQD